MPAFMKKKVIAICGSTRKTSSNLILIHAIEKLASEKFSMVVFQDIESIPHFNPDHDLDTPPVEVIKLRNQLREYDGILICTPEYAMGVPGTLKNMIDWTVSSMEFSKKPTVLITASSLGEKGHASLMETLKIIEADITEQMQLHIPYIKTKLNNEGQICDLITLDAVENLIEALSQKMK
jgi:chromate reductase, NAD(P)H dehydrogenase (quinone)